MADGNGAAPKRKRQRTETTWVLQVAFEVEIEPERELPAEGDSKEPTVVPARYQTAWHDAARVTVPAGTKRSTVQRRALEEAGVMPELGAPPVRTRLLDEDSAEETPVASELQLRIGGAS